MTFIRNILVISKWEALRPFKSKTTAIGFSTVLLSLILFQIFMSDIEFEAGSRNALGSHRLYTVGVSGVDELRSAIASYPKFDVVEVGVASDFDVYLTTSGGGNVDVATSGSLKGAVGLSEIAVAVEDVNLKRRTDFLSRNGEYTYLLNPVWVRLINYSTEVSALASNLTTTTLEGGAGNGSQAVAVGEDGKGLEGSIRPEGLEAPFPFNRFVKFFIVIGPLFFFSLYLASSVFREKVGRGGVYLLASPVRESEIILGKMLPYFTLTLILVLASSVFIGIHPLWLLLTILPSGVACLGIAVVTAILSKNSSDMNFTLMFFYMAMFAYLFYPVMFTGLNPLALISPLGALIQFLDGQLGFWKFLFILTPITLAGLISVVLAVRLFREEVVFSQKPTFYKLYDAMELLYAPGLGGMKEVVASIASGFILIPLVYLVELYFLFLLLPFGFNFIFILVPIAAFTEELAKVFGLAALNYNRRISGGFIYGALAGLGFYTAEKLIALGYIVDVFTAPGRQFILTSALTLTLLVHVVCSGIAGRGFALSKGLVNLTSLKYLLIASLLHTLYNLAVVGGVLHV